MSSPPPHPVLGTTARSAAELAAELRREFERALFERYGQPPGQDPVLAALFHAAAAQLARVYDEAEQVFPEAVFDDLVAGLGMPGRAARPAQTVVAFAGADAAELLTADASLVGVTNRGEQLAFSLDVPVRVSPSRLVFAAVVEGGRLQTVPGATLPDDPAAPGTPLPLPSSVVPLAAGPASVAPALYLAFDVDAAPTTHLSGLGLFFDVQGVEHSVARALGRSTWRLVENDAGTADPAGEPLTLRPRNGPGGVRLLAWETPGEVAPQAPSALDAADASAAAPAGAYGALCWRWPEVPTPRQVRSRPPQAVVGALADVLPLGYAGRYDRPLVWVEIALPAGTRGLAAALQRVVAHAAPASNLEPYAERVDVADLGAVVTFRPEGLRTRHLAAVLGITGEHGDRYVDAADPGAAAGRGRYSARGGDLELRPAYGVGGQLDRYAMVRLLYTDGPRANGLQPGDVSARAGRGGASASNVVVARGGSAPPAYAPAKTRFAEALRTRERVVTPGDVDAVARAFEPRVLGTRVRPATEPSADGVPQHVDVITATVRSPDFADPASELPALAQALERHLTARAPLGTAIRVEMHVLDRERRRTPRETR